MSILTIATESTTATEPSQTSPLIGTSVLAVDVATASPMKQTSDRNGMRVFREPKTGNLSAPLLDSWNDSRRTPTGFTLGLLTSDDLNHWTVSNRPRGYRAPQTHTRLSWPTNGDDDIEG